jgi:UDP-3-O-[3-hydroxymyristoyl] glucosamine N-acyltransferase
LAVDFSELMDVLGFSDCRFPSNPSKRITGVKSITSARPGDITFCSLTGRDGAEMIIMSHASAIICHDSVKEFISDPLHSTLVFVNNPRLAFLRCLSKFFNKATPRGVHETAVLESKDIGKNVYVGPFSHIGKKVVLGDNTIIYGGVHIYSDTIIGNDVIIDSGAVISSDGFGFEKNENMQLEKFHSIGGVEIHDKVEIGAHVCIDRGTLDNTVIGEGTKIDNLVHIGHNAHIGKNCIIVAQSLVGGSCTIDDNVYVAMSVCLRDHIRIGRNATVGMGAVVTKNVPANLTVIGVPAHPIEINPAQKKNQIVGN